MPESPRSRSTGPVSVADEQALAALEYCSNTGRWGVDDVLGTLNHITAEVRIAAAQLVRTGRVVSLAKPIDVTPSAVNVRPAWHQMQLGTERPYATADSLHLQVHGLANTHLDALGHMFLDGVGYNGHRQADVAQASGVSPLDIAAMADGIFTRGVVLDIAGARGRAWLPPDAVIGAADLEAAERQQHLEIRSGDAVFVHVGLERRESAEGPEDPGSAPVSMCRRCGGCRIGRSRSIPVTVSSPSPSRARRWRCRCTRSGLRGWGWRYWTARR